MVSVFTSRHRTAPIAEHSYAELVRHVMWQGWLLHRRHPTKMILEYDGDSDDSFQVEMKEQGKRLDEGTMSPVIYIETEKIAVEMSFHWNYSHWKS
jgi:hypothetical protein